MGYVRIRHSDSDLARSERQHEFLESIRSKVNPTIIPKLPRILSAITSDLHTDMTQDQMIALANFARKLKPEQIQLITLPNYEGRSYCYIYPDKARKVIAELFYDGNESMVKMDTPSWDQVAALNNSRGLNSAGEGGGGGDSLGRKRRSGRHSTALTDATTPRDDSGKPLADANDNPETATDLTPVDRSNEETVSDGKRARRKRHSDTGDASGDTPRGKDKDGSADAGSKDTKKDSGDKGDSGSKDTGSKSDGSGDKGDKSGDTGDKTGSGDKGDTTGSGAGGTF